MPGTVAGALRAAGEELADAGRGLDARDWWFRTAFDAPSDSSGSSGEHGSGEGGSAERFLLALDGLATVADVYLNGEHVLHGESMFAEHRIDVTGTLREHNELAICCRALAPLLALRRRPRARWRTALVDGNLRFHRTMLLGRAPSFAPGPPVIGPWRPVRLERRSGFALVDVRLRTAADGRFGVVALQLTGQVLPGCTPPDSVRVTVRGPEVAHTLEEVLEPDGEGRMRAVGRLRIPAERWWPHTHGEPVLYDVSVHAGLGGAERLLHAARVGFRELAWDPDWDRAGLSLAVNGTPVFARGAVWTPIDITMPHADAGELRPLLERVADAGMNMLRVPGIGCYESEDFYDLCDELGILVWQDFMFANLDYPDTDPAFRATVRDEADQVLGRLACRPSLAVLCGGSEVAQQVAMLGLDPELARGPLYTELLPAAVERADARVPYVPNSPWGGALPFRPDSGVANYYGVGAYRRPLTDARLAEVKFAAECLAFSNVPDPEALQEIRAPGGLVPHHPAWKAGVPRDAGTGWDFEDVRDHYLRVLYGLEAVELRWAEPERYLELSRAVSGEVMAEVFGEWRRGASTCAGGLVLWLRDLAPGAGWGVLDHRGLPKEAYHHLRRALAPVAVWSTDEGLGGITAHVANDRPEPLSATLRVALYRDGELPVEQASVPLELAAHSVAQHGVEDVLGRFVDVGWAYRFGPPGQDLIVVSIERLTDHGTSLLAQSFRFPVGRPIRREPAAVLGLQASVSRASGGSALLRVASRRLAHGVRILAAGYVPSDDAFSVEPGGVREVRLTARRHAGAGEKLPPQASSPPDVSITALNLGGRLRAAEVPERGVGKESEEHLV